MMYLSVFLKTVVVSQFNIRFYSTPLFCLEDNLMPFGCAVLLQFSLNIFINTHNHDLFIGAEGAEKVGSIYCQTNFLLHLHINHFQNTLEKTRVPSSLDSISTQSLVVNRITFIGCTLAQGRVAVIFFICHLCKIDKRVT